MGQTVNGTLSASDCRMSVDQSYVDYYSFRLSSATSVQIDLESDSFDTYLLLLSSAGTVLEEDDDGGSGLNSRIVRQLPAGLYVIGANSYSPNTTGAYQLRLGTPQPTS